MQKDFHYYCIGVLARAAGFNSCDALTIAFASQYVDDATESEPIPLVMPEGDLKFDPVRTAYAGLGLGRSISWSAQKRVWVPFHFLPPKPFRPDRGQFFSFVTERDSSFARLLVSLADSVPLENARHRLCRIGIALHTWADTWSHEAFSGRQNARENDVERIRFYHREEKKWEHLTLENVLFDLMPRIGHAEAGYFPDLAYARWKYTPGAWGDTELERDNVEHFTEAARTIYRRLKAMEKGYPERSLPWEGIEPGIRQLFMGQVGQSPGPADRVALTAHGVMQHLDVDRRCDRWKRKFSHLFRGLPEGEAYHYDRRDWRKRAFEGDIEWDDYSQRQWEKMAPLSIRNGFWDSLWVHFHRAALRQRHLVLEHLP